jgi:hypothetical protein
MNGEDFDWDSLKPQETDDEGAGDTFAPAGSAGYSPNDGSASGANSADGSSSVPGLFGSAPPAPSGMWASMAPPDRMRAARPAYTPPDPGANPWLDLQSRFNKLSSTDSPLPESNKVEAASRRLSSPRNQHDYAASTALPSSQPEVPDLPEFSLIALVRQEKPAHSLQYERRLPCKLII